MQRDVSPVAIPSPSTYLAAGRGVVVTEKPCHRQTRTPYSTGRAEVSRDG